MARSAPRRRLIGSAGSSAASDPRVNRRRRFAAGRRPGPPAIRAARTALGCDPGSGPVARHGSRRRPADGRSGTAPPVPGSARGRRRRGSGALRGSGTGRRRGSRTPGRGTGPGRPRRSSDRGVLVGPMGHGPRHVAEVEGGQTGHHGIQIDHAECLVALPVEENVADLAVVVHDASGQPACRGFAQPTGQMPAPGGGLDFGSGLGAGGWPRRRTVRRPAHGPESRSG